jgi:hypothetical protein
MIMIYSRRPNWDGHAEPDPPVSHAAFRTPPYPSSTAHSRSARAPPILLQPRPPAGTDAACQLAAVMPARRRSLSPSLPPPSATSIATPRPQRPGSRSPTRDENDGGGSDEVGRSFSGSEPPAPPPTLDLSPPPPLDLRDAAVARVPTNSGSYSLFPPVSSKVMGQGLKRPVPRTHPLTVFVRSCCFSMLQGDFWDVATDDFQTLQ